jgi:hypothetical protein
MSISTERPEWITTRIGLSGYFNVDETPSYEAEAEAAAEFLRSAGYPVRFTDDPKDDRYMPDQWDGRIHSLRFWDSLIEYVRSAS